MPLSIKTLFWKKRRGSLRSKWIFYLPVIGLAIIAFLLYIPDIHFMLLGKEIPDVPMIDFREKINIILTLAIASFAAVEGYSTYMHVVLADRRNRIEDARNELEKAYGPLYTMLNKFVILVDPQKEYWISPDEKNFLDKIMATYPFMFPSEIYNLWQEKIRILRPELVDGATLSPTDYKIPSEFIEKINKEYDSRVKEYNKLLKK